MHGRWPKNDEEWAAEVEELRAEGTLFSPESLRWPEGSSPPRTCSYCGGAHPEDLIELVRSGWLVEPTDKGYKRYVNTPNGDSIVPPVKLYVPHFDADQIARFNEELVTKAAERLRAAQPPQDERPTARETES